MLLILPIKFWYTAHLVSYLVKINESNKSETIFQLQTPQREELDPFPPPWLMDAWNRLRYMVSETRLHTSWKTLVFK